MALIHCSECGKEISSNAKACPHCGNPVPQQMAAVHISRNRTIAMAVNCYVMIDGNMVGELRSGESMDIRLPVGTHFIGIESDVRSFGYSAADTRGKSGQQFTINSQDKYVSISIATKGSWTGGVGRCAVDQISHS